MLRACGVLLSPPQSCAVRALPTSLHRPCCQARSMLLGASVSPRGGAVGVLNRSGSAVLAPPRPPSEAMVVAAALVADLLDNSFALCATPPTKELAPSILQCVIAEYSGPVVFGLPQGRGRARLVGGHVYDGQFHGGLLHGQGTYTWQTKIIYSGSFVSNSIEGVGRYSWPDGSRYEGGVLNGLRHGKGTFVCADGTTYVGDWLAGVRHGSGKLSYGRDGREWYEGAWRRDSKHGKGTMHYASGNTYAGEWMHNVKHGFGRMRTW